MLGIVSESDFDLELDRLNGNVSRGEITDLARGRGNGNKEVPEALRKVIADTAIQDGNKETKVLTRALGISDSSLLAYKNGATSTATYNKSDPDLKGHIDDRREEILSLSRTRLIEAINHITKDKLESAKARDLAGVAKDMSAVVKNLEPERSERNDSPTFIVYAPQLRHEQNFEVIHTNE